MQKVMVIDNQKRQILVLFGMLLMALMVVPQPLLAQEEALEQLKETGKAFAAVAREVSPAVVFVRVEKTIGAQTERLPSPFDDEMFRRFFGQPYQPQPRSRRRQVTGQGSGFIISSDGYILTNNHVVGEADRVRVKLMDGREFTAAIVGTDPPTDVAVIKIEARDLPVLQLGDSDRLEVGEWVLALGNPFGLSHTITAGIVSAKGRSRIGISDYENYIQTDAAINPGNSGGPLIDLEGKVVGINTAIFSRSGGYMGIGFAIPVNMARGIYTQLVETGRVTRGYLGVVIQELTPELASSFGLKDTNGVLISQVMPDGPADKAGLEQGDVVVRLDGQALTSMAPFRNTLAMTAPGTKVKLGVMRDGREKTITVKIGALATDEGQAAAQPGRVETLGIAVTTLTPELAQRYEYEGLQGVVVTNVDPESRAALAGMRPGMLISEVNRRAVRDAGDFERAIAESGKRPILLLIRDKQGSHYVAIDLKD